MSANNMKYLELLSKSFPTQAQVATEIVNLSAILQLPKGTEFFASDIHGEYEAFSHILRNGSGSVRIKLDEVFGNTLTDQEKSQLATLIYYPQEKMDLILPTVENERDWFVDAIVKLLAVARRTASKYTRSKVRKAIPEGFAFIIEELMTEYSHSEAKAAYYQSVIEVALSTGRGRPLVEALCLLIQRLSIDHLHIVGDIYDRGPAPDAIMEELMHYHSVDIQWGNHDIVWMGASQGQWGCIAHVVRQCARYGNLSILEDAYGINILPLANFAMRTYADDPCVAYGLKGNPQIPERQQEVSVKIQKAMTIMQFKVEGQLIDANPTFALEDRKLLDKINYETGIITLDGVEYPLIDPLFPTVDPADPFALTPEEESIMQRLEVSFLNSMRLQTHMKKVFLKHGGLYKVFNGNLLLHACVPLNEDGSLKEMDVFGTKYKGKALYEVLENYVRGAFFSTDPELRQRGKDLMWYLWLGEGSPLFAKSKMATFERYLIADKGAGKETKNTFYDLIKTDTTLDNVFAEFGLDPETGHIVVGHVPVKAKDGEDPVKCNGRVFTIDGGFSKAYQPTTGIAGYTLISNSHGIVPAAHEPLGDLEDAIANEKDIYSERRMVETFAQRQMVSDTDTGVEISQQIEDLRELLEAYRSGLIAEKC